ncbi:hypothetical protein C8J57DRAFT_1673466 [Mycena rebaudengoi]|nr:hypothetical protein C8J57DRAFT_1673466 [Mycena rebaudengoi]
MQVEGACGVAARAHAESQPARAHAGRAMLARADRKLIGWTRDAGMEWDRKKGRNEDEGVCGREKHYDGRRRMGVRKSGRTDQKNKLGHEKDRRMKTWTMGVGRPAESHYERAMSQDECAIVRPQNARAESQREGSPYDSTHKKWAGYVDMRHGEGSGGGEGVVEEGNTMAGGGRICGNTEYEGDGRGKCRRIEEVGMESKRTKERTMHHIIGCAAWSKRLPLPSIFATHATSLTHTASSPAPRPPLRRSADKQEHGVPGAYAQDVRARHARTWHAVCDVHHARKAQAVRWCSAPAVVHGAGPLWCASKTWMDGGVNITWFTFTAINFPCRRTSLEWLLLNDHTIVLSFLAPLSSVWPTTPVLTASTIRQPSSTIRHYAHSKLQIHCVEAVCSQRVGYVRLPWSTLVYPLSTPVDEGDRHISITLCRQTLQSVSEMAPRADENHWTNTGKIPVQAYQCKWELKDGSPTWCTWVYQGTPR